LGGWSDFIFIPNNPPEELKEYAGRKYIYTRGPEDDEPYAYELDLSYAPVFKLGKNVSQLFTASGFDTGGYTGAWGTDGRLAMLHQKELVLNASDTENMLAAVDILREVVR
jgi:hypothetical protein